MVTYSLKLPNEPLSIFWNCRISSGSGSSKVSPRAMASANSISSSRSDFTTEVNPKQLEDAVKKAVEEIGLQIGAATEIRRKEFDALRAQAELLLKRIESVLDKKLTVSVDVIRAQPPFILGPSTEKESRVSRRAQPRPEVSSSLPAAAAGNGNSSSSLDKGGKAILLAAAQCHPADRVQLSIVTGYKKSTRNRYIQHLQAKGLLEEKGDKIVPTPEGMNWANKGCAMSTAKKRIILLSIGSPHCRSQSP